MSTITSLGTTDSGSTSRTTINTNFTNLNTDKAESSTVTAHTAASTGVHGVSGSVIGSTDTQTLTNKTLTSPTLNSAVIAGATVSGTLSPVSGTYGITGANISGALNSLIVREVDFSLSDVTTANVSTTKHGLVPKLTNNTAHFFRSDGTYVAPAVTTTFASGVTSRAMNTASGSQTIAHGLGATPKYVRITAIIDTNSGTDLLQDSVGVYNGTTTSSIYHYDTNTANRSGTSSTNMVYIQESDTVNQAATVAVDGTNITLTWTLTGSGSSRTINMMWEAIA